MNKIFSDCHLEVLSHTSPWSDPFINDYKIPPETAEVLRQHMLQKSLTKSNTFWYNVYKS